MGKKLVLIFSCLISIVLFLFIGYLFGFLVSKQNTSLDLSREIYNKAEFEYKSADYINAIKYLEVANDIYKDYTFSIDYVKKIKNLNELIVKNPSDYSLYIQRGDLQNIEPVLKVGGVHSITSNYCEAVNDYTKALKLNNNANEVYHKRALAYIGCKNGNDFKINIIKDYLKAIDAVSNKDFLYEELANWYLYQADDIPNALKYYDKVEFYNEIIDDELYENVPAFSIDEFKYIPFKKIVCFEKLKDYTSILSLLDEIIQETDNEKIYKKANNLKFYYHLKTRNLKTAIKDANDCSAMICKVIDFLNFKDNN